MKEDLDDISTTVLEAWLDLDVRGVYFLQGEITKLIKIGVTENFRNRISVLQTMSPDRLKLVAFIPTDSNEVSLKIENFLHKEFQTTRAHGEWFANSPDLSKFIKCYGGDSCAKVNDLHTFIAHNPRLARYLGVIGANKKRQKNALETIRLEDAREHKILTGMRHIITPGRKIETFEEQWISKWMKKYKHGVGTVEFEKHPSGSNEILFHPRASPHITRQRSPDKSDIIGPPSLMQSNE